MNYTKHTCLQRLLLLRIIDVLALQNEVDPKIRTSDKVVTLNTCQNHETNQKSIQRGLQSQGSY